MILLFAASVIFTGCRSNDDPEYIVIDDGTINQNVYADEVAGESGIRFTTLAPWSSSVTEDWVSINPESGGTGTHNITISLTPNFTGESRTAIIAITSGSTTIEIRITQQGKTEDGEIPKEPFVIVAENVGGDDTGEIVTVRAVFWCEEEEAYTTISEAPFQNNGFTLQLNSAPTSFLFPLADEFLANFTISDRNAQSTFGAEGLYLDAFNSDDDMLGEFFLVGDVYVRWIYVDRDVTIRGTERYECCCGYEEFSIDLDLKRGWNIVYMYYCWNENTRTRRESFTTQRPTNVNLRWIFDYWGEEDLWSAHSADTRTTENRRRIFRR